MTDDTIQNTIAENIVAARAIERSQHTSSGKLTASAMGLPLQWQILKALGVPDRDVEEYTLRKFLRGDHVEEWILEHIPGLLKKQFPVKYREVVGLADAIVETKNWQADYGMMPVEIKSVANSKFKYLKRKGEADRGHKLQAGLYALAIQSKYFAVTYVASDDYRVLTYVYQTDEVKTEIEAIIDQFNVAMAAAELPLFSPKEDWQADEKYLSYADWSSLSSPEATVKLKKNHPEVYENWRNHVKVSPTII